MKQFRCVVCLFALAVSNLLLTKGPVCGIMDMPGQEEPAGGKYHENKTDFFDCGPAYEPGRYDRLQGLPCQRGRPVDALPYSADGSFLCGHCPCYSGAGGHDHKVCPGLHLPVYCQCGSGLYHSSGARKACVHVYDGEHALLVRHAALCDAHGHSGHRLFTDQSDPLYIPLNQPTCHG